MRAIEANPQTSQRELADAVGVSLGKVNYCLKALLDRGLVQVQSVRDRKNKVAYAYLLTPAGAVAKEGMATHFLKRKMSEYEALRREINELKDLVGK